LRQASRDAYKLFSQNCYAEPGLVSMFGSAFTRLPLELGVWRQTLKRVQGDKVKAFDSFESLCLCHDFRFLKVGGLLF